MKKEILAITDKYKKLSCGDSMDLAIQMVIISTKKRHDYAIFPVLISKYKSESLNSPHFSKFIECLEDIVSSFENHDLLNFDFLNSFYIHSDITEIFISRKVADSSIETDLIELIHDKIFNDYKLKVIFDL